MTLLEYYAGQALVGVLANETASGAIASISNSGQDLAHELSHTAWELAQAMLDTHPQMGAGFPISV